jgi:predicted dienelactone hydrolase
MDIMSETNQRTEAPVKKNKQESNPKCASPEKRKDIMNIKHFRSILLSVCLGWLAPWLALAQPVITKQPSDRFVNASNSVTFSVLATGVAPITYQWLFDGTAIADATSQLLWVTNAQPAQSGYYSVIASNAAGSVTSQVAVLKVFIGPPTPHGFSGIQAESGGSVNLNFKGETTALFAPYYDLYPLETSTNLVDWAPLATLQRTNTALDTLQFLDNDAPQFSQRFYRTPTNALLTPIPQPTGPYSVGTFSMMLTDPSRTNTALHTNYQFMVTFWYPAVAQAGVLPAKYMEPQIAMCGVYVIAAGSSWSNRLVAFFSQSLSNAPLATNLVKYPVVLYSPGWTGHRRDNTGKAEDLASWGYVVVGLDHRDTFLSVLPDGTLLHGQSKFTNTLNGVPLIEDRLRDEQFVLDELQSLNANDPRLGGRLDLDKIGAFGGSLGGATAAQLCLRDPRCKAGANFDGTYFETDMMTQTLGVPWLFFCEDETAADESPPNDDELPVFNHVGTNAYWVKLKSTDHGCFSDWDLIVDSASLQNEWGTPVSGQFLPPARVSQIVRAYVLSFFNKFLLGEDDHLLDGPSSAYPEVEQFLKH